MTTPPMKATIIPVTPFVQNCSLAWCTQTMLGAVVDPGGDTERISSAIEENGVRLEKVLLTHGHLDHAGGAADIAETYGVPIEGPHPDDQFWIDGMPEQARMFGVGSARSFSPDRWLKQDDTITVGALNFEVHHCPGHTPGHVILFHRPSKLAMVGDVLFAGSIGRTDFPRGDHATLINSIKTRLWPLGDDVSFIPGHGPMSTFGEERQTNPFVRD